MTLTLATSPILTPCQTCNFPLVESVEEEEGEEESEESEDEDVFELKDFVEIQDGKVQKSYCIEEEVGR